MKKTFVIFVIVWIFLPGWAQSGKLDPFVFPEMQRQETPPKKDPVVDESVYEKFKAKVEKLAKNGKEKLYLSFKEKQEEAVKGEEWAKVKHYQRLLELLKPSKKGVEK